jgi:hypothetical protein
MSRRRMCLGRLHSYAKVSSVMWAHIVRPYNRRRFVRVVSPARAADLIYFTLIYFNLIYFTLLHFCIIYKRFCNINEGFCNRN